MNKLEPYIRVINYYETDQMQVVHHSNYARFLEECRLWVMEKAGLPYDLMEEKGVIIPVPREPAVHIWVKPVDLANTHIMARVKAAHTEIVMSIVLTLLN